jgi:hypothetical protein
MSSCKTSFFLFKKILLLIQINFRGDYQSTVLDEFKDRTFALLKDAKNSGSAMARLEPLAWKLFDMGEQITAYLHSTDAEKATDYGKWLDRLC